MMTTRGEVFGKLHRSPHLNPSAHLSLTPRRVKNFFLRNLENIETRTNTYIHTHVKTNKSCNFLSSNHTYTQPGKLQYEKKSI